MMAEDFRKRLNQNKINIDKSYRPGEHKTSRWWTHLFTILFPFEDVDGNPVTEWKYLILVEGKEQKEWPQEWVDFFIYVTQSDPYLVEEAIKLKENLLIPLDIQELENKLASRLKEEEAKYENEVKIIIHRWNRLIDEYGCEKDKES